MSVSAGWPGPPCWSPPSRWPRRGCCWTGMARWPSPSPPPISPSSSRRAGSSCRKAWRLCRAAAPRRIICRCPPWPRPCGAWPAPGRGTSMRASLPAVWRSELKSAGSALGAADLAGYRAAVVPALEFDYRGHRIAGVPGLSGGPALQQVLGGLAGRPLNGGGARHGRLPGLCPRAAPGLCRAPRPGGGRRRAARRGGQSAGELDHPSLASSIATA